MNFSVAALVATYRRPRELARLLDSLAKIERGLSAVIVVDNGASDETRAIVESARCPAQYVNAGCNLGCGGGLRLAEARALAGSNITHVLILDDDAVLAPDTLERLVAAMEREHADLACPLVIGPAGCIGWLPGVVREVRQAGALTAESFRARFGDAPREFTWAQGICLLVTRRALEAAGLHRDDFWVRGEDLEFSLRLTARGRGIFVPEAVVEHLPPPAEADESLRAGEYLKHCALVQNIACIGFRLPHGRRIAWTILGALRHFFSLWKWRALGDAARALWRGAALGEPAGRGEATNFRARFDRLHGA